MAVSGCARTARRSATWCYRRKSRSTFEPSSPSFDVLARAVGRGVRGDDCRQRREVIQLAQAGRGEVALAHVNPSRAAIEGHLDVGIGGGAPGAVGEIALDGEILRCPVFKLDCIELQQGMGPRTCGSSLCSAHSWDFVTAPLGREREPSQSTWNLSSAVK
jgi:hypothetical protein